MAARHARRAALVLLTMVVAACVTAPQRVERDALAAFNRCIAAVKGADPAQFGFCLSERLKGRYAEDRGGSETEGVSEGQLRAFAEVWPQTTQVRSVTVSEDLGTVTLDTINYTSLLDQQIEHAETIVLVREAGRWVIDKGCCDYSASRFIEQ